MIQGSSPEGSRGGAGSGRSGRGGLGGSSEGSRERGLVSPEIGTRTVRLCSSSSDGGGGEWQKINSKLEKGGVRFL